MREFSPTELPNVPVIGVSDQLKGTGPDGLSGLFQGSTAPNQRSKPNAVKLVSRP